MRGSKSGSCGDRALILSCSFNLAKQGSLGDFVHEIVPPWCHWEVL